MARVSLENPAYYINPEVSWLGFNRRVLEEAEDERNPLLERVKFLAITANNLDEFFEVRIAGLVQRIEDGYTETGADGLEPTEQRDLLARESHDFVNTQYRIWNQQLLPALAEHGIRVLALQDLNPEQQSFIADYCERELDPLLTPVTVDPSHPFPRVINKALCLAFLLKRRRRSATTFVGVVTVPRALPRLVRLPSEEGAENYIFLADLVAHHAASMYRGYDIVSSAAFRVTRNSNLYLQEEESRSLLESVRTELHNRRRGDAVRLEIEAGADPEIIERLRTNFELENWQVFQTDGAVNLSRLFTLYDQTDRPELKYKPFAPHQLQLTAKSRDLFEELRRHDVLLHHPYDSYDTVVGFVESAATDPRVMSIKQTLYRTSEESPIIRALVEAAAKKEVTVVVELKARFDEAPNIRWARHLEDAGVQVFHGLVGLKTHCKLALLVRRDPDGETRQYAHLGTGNYNHVTSRLYTDLSLLTAEESMTASVHAVFNFLTAYAERQEYEPLMLAPLDMAQKTITLIDREADHARHKRPGRIIAKMNALTDKNIIQALYRASQAGVQIDLVVRGMCSLVAGVRGVSDRIRVRSIVGRFLEHSRIFYFLNDGEEECWVGSADWMPRNLYDRVEVLFPVADALLRQRLKQEILASYLADNMKARFLQTDGSYIRAGQLPQTARTALHLPRKPFCAQEFLIGLAEGRQLADAIPDVEKRGAPRRRLAAR
ncbi:MAG: polyphosphate kinase 1 [Terriglobales bacterium]